MRIYKLLAIAGALPLAAWSQTCSGNETLFGPFLFVASRDVPDPTAPAMPPGQPVVYSNSAMGRLIQGAQGGAPFAVAGKMVADGLGNLLAGPPDVVTLTVRVGTYRVNGDCTFSATLVDGFRSGLDLLGDPLLGARETFQGVLQNRADEAVLVQTGARKGAVVRMSRPYLAQNCTRTTLSGPYGILATGLQYGSMEMPAIQPFSLLGRFHADNGEFRADTPGIESPQQARQFSGTYRVEPDCTGTADFVIDGAKQRVEFVLLRGGVRFGVFERAEMRFALQDSRRVGTGVAR